MYARNTNVQHHPEAACRVCWLTLVPGERLRPQSACRQCRHTVSRTRVRRSVIAPEVGLLGRGLKVRTSHYSLEGYSPHGEPRPCSPTRLRVDL